MLPHSLFFIEQWFGNQGLVGKSMNNAKKKLLEQVNFTFGSSIQKKLYWPPEYRKVLDDSIAVFEAKVEERRTGSSSRILPKKGPALSEARRLAARPLQKRRVKTVTRTSGVKKGRIL
jgi:hypothetical protein